MKIKVQNTGERQPGDIVWVPDELLGAQRAERVYGQKLERLNERGGLGPIEAVSLILRESIFDLVSPETRLSYEEGMVLLADIMEQLKVKGG